MTIGNVVSNPLFLLVGGVLGVTAIIVVIGIVKVGIQELRNDFRGRDGRGSGGEYDESPDVSGPVDDGRSNEDAVQLGVDKDEVSEAIRDAAPDDEVGVGGGLEANTYDPEHVEADKEAAVEGATPDGLSAGQAVEETTTNTTSSGDDSRVSEPEIDRSSEKLKDDMIPDTAAADPDLSSSTTESETTTDSNATDKPSKTPSDDGFSPPASTDTVDTGDELFDEVNTEDLHGSESSYGECGDSDTDLDSEETNHTGETGDIFENADDVLSDDY